MKEYSAHDSLIYASSVRHEMVEFIPESAQRVLDVGCSVGNFGELLKIDRKIEVWGVEIDEKACSIASQKLDKVICGGFGDDLNLPEKHFDCIVFNDVLEHMDDPYSALKNAKKLLQKGGKVVASIPNVRYFDNMWNLVIHKNWDYVESGILDRTHLRFFTVKSIFSLFTDLGYEIETIQGINPLEENHPYFIKKFYFLKLITLNKIEDMRWMQFAVVASPIKLKTSQE
jgi:2-polyprenyl-3-methyl-5-hydroxy-6-metoxy-1,4-benzoquinol methylase